MTIKSTSKRHRLQISAILVLALGVVLVFAQAATAAKQEKSSGFLGYLYELLAADEVPVAPGLSSNERQAMDKLETLLKAQNDRSPDGGNFILLAALAGARNDVCKAESYLSEASCLLPESPLPATMRAQVYTQAGDFERAKEIHHCALSKVGNACQSPALAANSYMDLAVVYAQSGDAVGARKLLIDAETVLVKASRDRTQAALGWFQMGVVYADSLNNLPAAMCAWKNGSRVLEKATMDEASATLKIDLDVRVADSLIACGQCADAADYLENASRVLCHLSDDSKPEAQFQIGSSYVELAMRNPNDSTYAARAAEQLSVLTEQDTVPPETLGAHRDAALAYAKLVQTCSPAQPEQAEQLIAKAMKWTLQIGEMNSAYAPVFSPHVPPSPGLDTLNIQLIQDSSTNNP